VKFTKNQQEEKKDALLRMYEQRNCQNHPR